MLSVRLIRIARGARYIPCAPSAARDRQGAGPGAGQDPPDARRARPTQAAALARAALRDTLDRRRRRAPRRPARARARRRAGRVAAERLRGHPPARRRPRRAPRRRVRGRRRARLPRRDGHAAGHAASCSTPGSPAVAGGDSAFGPALDGGYWGDRPARRPIAAVFAGVPDEHRRHRRASSAPACARSACSPPILPPLRDVDTFDDAPAVAAEAPGTRFAAALAARSTKGWRRDRVDRDRRRGPLPADAALRAPARLRRAAPRRRRPGAAGAPPAAPTAGSSRCRSTAGWRRPTRRTRRSSPTSTRRCSTSAAGRAAISRRCAALGKRGLGRRPLARRGRRSRAGAGRTRSPARCGRACPARAWRTILLLDGNIGIGGAPVALLRRAGELLAPDGRIVVETDPPGAPTHRVRVRLEAPGARLRVVPLGARRAPTARPRSPSAPAWRSRAPARCAGGRS